MLLLNEEILTVKRSKHRGKAPSKLTVECTAHVNIWGMARRSGAHANRLSEQ